MLGSKNDFFKQKNNELLKARLDMNNALKLVDRNSEDVNKYNDAFIYFCANPNDFDGATIMRDLFILKKDGNKLDVDAMLHDYEYITGANRNFIKKWNTDLSYFNNMLLNGKGVQLFRLIALIVTGIFFVPYAYLKNLKNE